MKSLTKKMALAALVAATIGSVGSAFAGDRGESSWWFGRSNDSSANTAFNFSGSSGGKAVTKTEVFAGKSVLPMVSPMSDRWLADAVSRYEAIVARGGWPAVGGSRLARASSGPDVVKLRQRLVAEGYTPPESLGGQNAEEYSDAVMKAVAQFQANHGLAITGKVDKSTAAAMNVSAAERLATLRANEPRIHEYSKDLGPRYIIVNVPALQLEAVNFNSVFSRHNIIAGQPSRPTPVTLTQISDINFNPYWNAPVSIVEKDIIPRVQREGTRVLRDMNMRIYDGFNGPEVNPEDVDWDNVPPDRFFFRQDPGAENAMATVKINFPSPFGIYLHDTPTKNLFTVGSRYLSSGCVRVEQVHVLVNWILNGQDGWNPSRIEQVAASHERMDVKVKDGPQLRTVYLTAWPSANGLVNFRDDIYNLDGSGFVVGQPLAPGESSEDGRRYVLKPVTRDASANADDGEYYKPRHGFDGFGLFSSFRAGTSSGAGRPRLIPNRREEETTVINNLFSQPQPVKKATTKASALEKGKKAPKKKLLQVLGPTQKSGEKTSKKIISASKKATVPESGADAKKKQPADSAVAIKKKKTKVEEASVAVASPAPHPKPIFTQQ
jgi:murein L,D-transpeptidase YcbB/YkuD